MPMCRIIAPPLREVLSACAHTLGNVGGSFHVSVGHSHFGSTSLHSTSCANHPDAPMELEAAGNIQPGAVSNGGSTIHGVCAVHTQFAHGACVGVIL